MKKKILLLLASLFSLFIPALVQGACSPISLGGTGQCSFPAGIVYSPGGTLPLQSVATSSLPFGVGTSTEPFMAKYYVATSTLIASVFPYASTTAVTTTGAHYFAGSGIWNASGKVGVASTTPTNFLSVEGSIDLNGNAGSYKQDNVTILTASTTSGFTYGGLLAGANMLATTTVLGGNTAFGYQAMQNATSTYTSVAIGYQALKGASNNSAQFRGDNVAVGYQALLNNTTGFSNTGIGSAALKANTSGNSNFGLGTGALAQNTGGGANIGIGVNAGAGIQGNGNIMFGTNAGNRLASGNSNLGIGNSTYFFTTTGTRNVAVGEGGLASLTSGNDNTTLGFNAGVGYTSANKNIAIGSFTASTTAITGSKNILLGYDIGPPDPTASNTLNIGNLIFGTGMTSEGTSSPAGFVGIGTTSPFGTLSVESANSGIATPQLVVRSTGNAAVLLLDNAAAAGGKAWKFATGASGSGIVQDFALSDVTGNITPFLIRNAGNGFDTGAVFLGGNINNIGTGAALSALGNGNVGISTTSAGVSSRLTVWGSGTGNEALANFVNNASTTVMQINDNGNVGIGTTTPGSLLSLGVAGNASGINFSLATSTFENAGGINLTTGCFAINGTCVGGGGGTTYSAGNGLSLAATTFSINPAFSNWWTARQNFTNATTSQLTASSSVWFTSLGTAAGSFLAVDPNGLVIATSSPSGSNSAFSPSANYATVTALPSNTYSNGASGVGATITEVGTGALSVDGASPSVGQRVLVKNEATGANNGLYSVTVAGSGIAAFVLTRDTSYDSANEIIPGVITYVISGSTLNDDFWAMTSAAPITVGTTALTYVEVSGGGANVTSVSNSDGTLTISPTAGSVVASLALAHPNTWTGLQTITNASTTNLTASASLFVNNQKIIGKQDKSIAVASSTIAYTGGSASATTSLMAWNPSSAITITDVYCKSTRGTGTYYVAIGSGSATSTVQCNNSGGSASGLSIAVAARGNVYFEFGNGSGTADLFTPTLSYTNQ